MQDILIDLGWKSALIACAVLVACRALRGRAAGERVLLLRVGVGALLALPMVALLAPSFELAVLPAEEVTTVSPLAGDGLVTAGNPDAAEAVDLLLLLYCAGAAAVLLRLSLGLLSLWRWTRSAKPATDPDWTAALARAAAGIKRPVRLLVSRKVRAPLSWGVAPAWILIGHETERRPEQAGAVLAHEMAHVRRFDWPMLMLAQLATALLWFNPVVWWLGRMLAGQIELAADEEALRHVARHDYAQTLLAVGAGSAHRSACGMTYARSTLGRRIRDVLEAAPQRSASRLLCAAMLVAATAMTGSLAALRLVPAEAQLAQAPELASYLPAIIPQAQARETQETPKPAPQRKRRKQSVALAGVTVSPPTPAAPAEPPKPRSPQAPGAQQANAASLETRRAINEAKRAAFARVAADRPHFAPQDRRKAYGMAEAAKGMRVEARNLEALAADPRATRQERNEYVRTASNLRREAQNLDRDARRLIIKP